MGLRILIAGKFAVRYARIFLLIPNLPIRKPLNGAKEMKNLLKEQDLL